MMNFDGESIFFRIHFEKERCEMKKLCKRLCCVCMALLIVTSALAGMTAAAVSNTAADVCFVVPEVIYLAPNMNAATYSGTHTFQQYVNNSSAGTALSATETTGKLYFVCDSVSSATLTYQWVNASTPSGSISVNGLSIPSGSTIPFTPGETLTITAGVTPSIPVIRNDLYIRWTVAYTDQTDGRNKTVSAYTYVYKPYVQPVGTAIRNKNDRGTDSYGSNISWISGVHGIVTDGNYYPATTQSQYGLVPFSSALPFGQKVDELYAPFTGSGFFINPDNRYPDAWLSSTPAGQQDKSISYFMYDRSTASFGDVATYILAYSPTAKLSVDTSRYTNLAQVPNLSVGMLVTDDEEAKYGAWFVSNYTGTPAATAIMDYQKGSTSEPLNLWNRYSQSGEKISFMGDAHERNYEACHEGVKFNRRWQKNLSVGSNTTSVYMLGAGYMNDDSSGDTIWNISELRCSVRQLNKKNLRQAVQEAIRVSGTACKAADRDAETWKKYTALYDTAYKTLTALEWPEADIVMDDATYTTPDALAAALTNATRSILLLAQQADEPQPSTQFTFKVPAIKAVAGSRVQVAVQVENNPGIIMANLSVSYDTTKLQLLSVQESGMFGEGAYTAGNNLNAVPYTTLWVNGTTRENITANGTIVTYTFAVQPDAATGVTPIELSVSSVCDVDLQAVPFAVENGGIEIFDSTPGDVSGDKNVDLIDVAILTRYLADWDVEIDAFASDVNADGKVNLKDVTILRRYLAGWEGIELRHP